MNDEEAIQHLKKGDVGGLAALVLAYQERALRNTKKVRVVFYTTNERFIDRSFTC